MALNKQQVRRQRSNFLTCSLICLVLILFLTAILGYLYAMQTRQKAIDQAHATAAASALNTAIVQANATQIASTHVTATAIASTQATATAIAQATATAVAITQAQATAVAQANPDPYPPAGTLVFYNPLDGSNNLLDGTDAGYAWDSKPGCNWNDAGAYHAIETQLNNHVLCYLEQTNFGNFTFEMLMTISSGNCGGLIFRADNTISNFYSFEVCQDGFYDLAVWTNNVSKYLIDPKYNQAIRTGQNLHNLIAVVANGKNITLYVNSILIDSINDTTYSQGEIGVFAASQQQSTEVTYNYAKVWTW